MYPNKALKRLQSERIRTSDIFVDVREYSIYYLEHSSYSLVHTRMTKQLVIINCQFGFIFADMNQNNDKNSAGLS